MKIICGQRSQFLWCALPGGYRETKAGTIPEAVGKIGPVPDTISVPLVMEAQNSSCAQGVVKEMGKKSP